VREQLFHRRVANSELLFVPSSKPLL
jgi:hypothetical protein